MASSTLERYLAVGSGSGGCQMPLKGAGCRQRTLDAVKGRGVQVVPPTLMKPQVTGLRFSRFVSHVRDLSSVSDGLDVLSRYMVDMLAPVGGGRVPVPGRQWLRYLC